MSSVGNGPYLSFVPLSAITPGPGGTLRVRGGGRGLPKPQFRAQWEAGREVIGAHVRLAGRLPSLPWSDVKLYLDSLLDEYRVQKDILRLNYGVRLDIRRGRLKVVDRVA